MGDFNVRTTEPAFTAPALPPIHARVIAKSIMPQFQPDFRLARVRNARRTAINVWVVLAPRARPLPKIALFISHVC